MYPVLDLETSGRTGIRDVSGQRPFIVRDIPGPVMRPGFRPRKKKNKRQEEGGEEEADKDVKEEQNETIPEKTITTFDDNSRTKGWEWWDVLRLLALHSRASGISNQVFAWGCAAFEFQQGMKTDKMSWFLPHALMLVCLLFDSWKRSGN